VNEYRNQQMPPSIDPSVPLTKPVQQLVTSPVDKWGLAALLRLIRTGANSDLLALSLGEDLATLGLDMNSSA
jgi:CCR4-NOT transcription complex subunit 2